jgi:uncharacterized membrane protein YdbT with pleckstrin-like domain
MSYVEDNLMPNEKILLRSKITPFIFLSPLVIFLMALFFVFYSISQTNNHTESGSAIGSVLFCFAGILFLYSIIEAISVLARMLTTEFAVTNRRVIAKSGFIRRNSLDLRLTKIESVEVNQNILGRMLSFGTITLTGTGGTHQSFRGIVDPVETKKKINHIIEFYNTQLNNSQNGMNANQG